MRGASGGTQFVKLALDRSQPLQDSSSLDCAPERPARCA
jgi:hypothetical protein